MRNFTKIAQGLFSIILVGAVLLISDRSNRTKNTSLSKENFRIALVQWVDIPTLETVEEGVLKSLGDRGLVRDKNLSIDVYKASGDITTLNSILNQVKNENYDLLLVSCTPALQASLKTIKTMPIVFTAVADPVLAGAGTDFKHHKKNITGCSVICDFESMMQLIKANAPKIKTLGTVYCPGEIISVKFKAAYTGVAAKYGFSVQFFPASNASELPDAVLAMTTANIDAVCQMGDNLMASGISTLIKAVSKKQIPYFEFNSRPKGSKMESLIQINLDYYQNGYDAGSMAADILLNKVDPGTIPFKVTSSSVLEINPVKAKQFGIQFTEATRNKASIILGEKELFPRKINIAMVHYAFSEDCFDVTHGILQEFKEIGHVKDKDFSFDEYNANADIATLNNIVNAVANKKYDLIFATTLPTTQALLSKIKDVPILFTVVADPAGNGLGKSYSDHLPNLSGIDALSYTDEGVKLVLQYLPNTKTIGVLSSPGEPAAISEGIALKKSCDQNHIKLVSIPVNTVTEVVDATTLLCSKNIDAILQLPDAYTIPAFSSMVKVTSKMKIPLFCFISSQVKMGAVAAIAGDFIQQGKEIADIGIAVIKGKSPADIPFSRIKQIKTVINPAAATTYGIQTPKDLLKTANEVIVK